MVGTSYVFLTIYCFIIVICSHGPWADNINNTIFKNEKLIRKKNVFIWIDLERIWLSFFNELHHLSLIQVPRFVNISEGRRYELCGFVEASIQGYAAVAFLHVTDSLSNVSVSLLGSKTKLASPTKTITIPCLELCVTGLLARWLIRILSTLLSQVKIQGAYTWSDSSVVLSWMNTPHVSYKVYVSNRINQILK